MKFSNINKISRVSVIFLFSILLVSFAFAQDTNSDSKSIGGEEHDLNIYGVQIGMDVPTALQAVFVNANRKPGQEKPDALRKEGKDNKDIRVLYNDLPKGNLQIVFDEGKYVKEIILSYTEKPTIEKLRLASSSNIGVASSGERFDDRYTIGFIDNTKTEKLWWRDEKTEDDYKIRLSFVSGNATKDGQLWWQTIFQKAVTVKPGDDKKFRKAMSK